MTLAIVIGLGFLGLILSNIYSYQYWDTRHRTEYKSLQASFNIYREKYRTSVEAVNRLNGDAVTLRNRIRELEE